ncbi:MAG: hypothetical protein M3Y87_10690 [Myxococcota bacterium]|nr:hypothetical protein [Myxococcota bacterium]
MPPIAVIRTERDVYANLLRDTRGLRREHGTARDVWFASLPWERKEETLFELEMLLKGLACFGNPRNHPGAPAAKSTVAQDFHEELRIVRDATQRVVTLIKQLLGDKERAYTFTRYLESVLPEDSARGQLVQDQLTQDTPEEALLLLRNAFGHFLDLSEGLIRLGRVSNRLYFAMHGVVVREIGRNAYFNPLMALEFRPEFDRIRSGEALEALHTIESETGHRVTALAFLALFRALRYVSLIDAYASDTTSTRRSFVILAVLRSDLRALTRYLTRRAGDAIADGLEREIMQVPSDDIGMRFVPLAESAQSLARIRRSLEHVASALRVELRKIYEHDLPSPQTEIAAAELGPQMIVAAAELRASIQNAILALCADIRPGEAVPELATDLGARRAASDRLRREIWMFQQILRAFVAKADAVSTASSQSTHDRWAGQASFQFVRDFLGHFRAIGYQLVRSHDYERLDPFLASLERLRDVDLLEPHRMQEAVDECRAFLEFLGALFASVSSRAELAGVPFDRQAAGEVLKIYLGRS